MGGWGGGGGGGKNMISVKKGGNFPLPRRRFAVGHHFPISTALVPQYIVHSTLQRKSHFCVPRKGIARPQSQFPHSCVCERFIYFHDRSAYSPSPWVIISLSLLRLFHSTLFTTLQRKSHLCAPRKGIARPQMP